MSRFACVFGLLLIASLAAGARHAHHVEPPAAPIFAQAGGLQFLIPAAWQTEPNPGPARLGQWMIPPPHVAGATVKGVSNNSVPEAGDGIEVVVFFFGPGVGGSAKENIDAWSGTITGPDGKPATATPQKRTIAGHAITEVVFSGTYAQVNPQPALPPTLKSGYSLIGAVVDNPAGTIYWRVTGPSAQVMAFAPEFDQMLDSLQPQAGP
jgi:hypothetical protein